MRDLSFYSMPVLNFNKKVKRSVVREFNKVLPTVFVDKDVVKVKGKVTNYYSDDDVDSAVMQMISNDKTIKINWCQINNDIYAYLDELSKNETRVVYYIIKYIKPNSNVIEFDYSEFAKMFNIEVRTVVKAISDLANRTNNQIIQKTTIKGIYVVNHKLIFKGDYDKFLKEYYVLYDGELAQLDDKGRIIINHLKR